MSEPPLQSFFSHPDVQPDTYLCSGHRADVYRIRYQNQDAIAKVYKPYYIRKYHKRYKTDIARFEFERNKRFYDIDALRPYCARPCMYLPACDQHPSIFIQEYVDGENILAFATRHSYLPKTVVELGYMIVHMASQNGLYDLDIHDANVFIVKDELGFKPVVCDFNMMPRDIAPPNPWMALSFFFRLRKRSYRDYRNLLYWQRFPMQ